MREYVVFCFCMAIGVGINAQDFNTPEAIFKIMEASDNVYEVSVLQRNLETNFKGLNPHGIFIMDSEEGPALTTYGDQMSAKSRKLYAKGEKMFADEKHGKARKFYAKMLEEDPENSKIMTYMGQIYEIEENYEEAKNWYEKAVASNYLDFMAHWFLADNLFLNGELEKALYEITAAHILNRNNPRIIKSLERIYKGNNIHFDANYVFPQAIISAGEGKKVAIDYRGTPWLAYGMCKAVWEFENGYRTKRDPDAPEGFSELEEREAMMNALMVYESLEEEEVFKEMDLFKVALEKEKTAEFIFYELWLPKQPLIIAMIGEQGLEDMINYLLELRSSVPMN